MALFMISFLTNSCLKLKAFTNTYKGTNEKNNIELKNTTSIIITCDEI
jgi:hypothetical protein